MRKTLAAALLVASLPAATLFSTTPEVAATQSKEDVAKTSLKVGDRAPDFTLLSDGYWENGKWIDKWKNVKLSDYQGKKNVLLAVYVLAFTGG